MKRKEFGAAAVLCVLLAFSLWNIRTIDTLTDRILLSLAKSQSCAEKLDIKGAGKNLDEGLELWLEAEGYTHIFIRHSEIDSTTDAFYELRQLIAQGDPAELKPVYEKLRYHLESIDAMEHPSLGSIL